MSIEISSYGSPMASMDVRDMSMMRLRASRSTSLKRLRCLFSIYVYKQTDSKDYLVSQPGMLVKELNRPSHQSDKQNLRLNIEARWPLNQRALKFTFNGTFFDSNLSNKFITTFSPLHPFAAPLNTFFLCYLNSA